MAAGSPAHELHNVNSIGAFAQVSGKGHRLFGEDGNHQQLRFEIHARYWNPYMRSWGTLQIAL